MYVTQALEMEVIHIRTDVTPKSRFIKYNGFIGLSPTFILT